MKLSACNSIEVSASVLQVRPLWADCLELVKARLTFLVLLTTFCGFYLAGGRDLALGIHLLLGTACVACSAAILNQLIEKEWDAEMQRTANRPIPGGRISPAAALWSGFALGLGGLLYLFYAVNLLTAALAAVTLGSYLYVYTPLKRITHLNTLVGAIPGALPPLIGWAAVQPRLSVEAWALWAILFCWQLPHFLAIGYLYEEEYRHAGFCMLASVDSDGKTSGRQALIYSAVLLPLVFFFLKGQSIWMLLPAVVLGVWLMKRAFDFYRRPGKLSARRLFLASILYLPLLFVLFCVARS